MALDTFNDGLRELSHKYHLSFIDCSELQKLQAEHQPKLAYNNLHYAIIDGIYSAVQRVPYELTEKYEDINKDITGPQKMIFYSNIDERHVYDKIEQDFDNIEATTDSVKLRLLKRELLRDYDIADEIKRAGDISKKIYDRRI